MSHFRCTFLNGCIFALIQNTARRLSVTWEVLQNTCRFIRFWKNRECIYYTNACWPKVRLGPPSCRVLNAQKTPQSLPPDALLGFKCCSYVILHLNHWWLSLLLQTTQWLQSRFPYLFLWAPGSIIFSNVFIPVKQGGAVTQVTDGKLRLKDILY